MFRFTLIDYTTNPLGDSTVIPEPLGFDKLELIIKRDDKLNGIFFYPESFDNLQFYGESAEILQNAYNTNGISAKCEMIIEFRCEDYGDYTEIAHLKFDFTELEKICDDFCSLKIAMNDISCSTILMNRWDTKVNLESLKSLDSTTDNLAPYNELGSTLQTNTGLVEFVTKADLDVYADPLIPNFYLEFSGVEWDYQTTPVLGPRYEGQFIATFNSNLQINDIQEKFITYAQYLINGTYYDLSDGSGFDAAGPFATNSGFYQEVNPESLACSSELIFETEMNLDFYFDSASTNSQDVTFYVRVRVVQVRNLVNINQTVLYLSGQQTSVPGVGLLLNVNIPFTSITFPDVQNGDYITCFIEMTNFVGYTYKLIKYDLYRVIMKYLSGYMRIRKQRICESSEYKGYLVNETFSRVAEAVTNDCLRVYSDYLGRTDAEPYPSDTDGCMGYLSITDGLNVRKAVLSDDNLSELSISMKSLYDGFNPICNIGMGMEADPNRPGYELLRIEPTEYFYQNTEIVDLSGAKMVSLKTLPENYIQNLTFGYQNFETERTNGLDDVHAQREYRSELDNVRNPLQLVSQFMASHYAFELTRREIGRNVIDWRYDNTVFVMMNRRKAEGDPEGSYNFISELLDSLYDIAINIRAAAYYRNIRITPMRNILRHVKRLFEVYLPLAKSYIFTAGSGNFKAKIQYKADVECLTEKHGDEDFDGLYENQDISVSLLNDPSYGIPYKQSVVSDFDIPMTFDQYLNIKANPYGYIRYSCNNNDSFGWIKEIRYNPSTGMASVMLIERNS